jgi:drug/metabolite transporter (DMT)-like permease
VVLATLGMAFKGVFVRLAVDAGSGPIGVLGWRVLLASPLFWLFGLLRHRGPLRRRDALASVGCGLFYIVAAVADFLAIDALGAALSRVVLFSFPGFLLLFDAVQQRRAPPRREVVGFVVAWAGLGLVVAGRGGPGAGGWVGFGWGLLAASSYAAYLRLSQRWTRQVGVPAFAALANVGTFLAAAVLVPALAGPEDAGINGAVLGWSVALAVVSTAVPFVMLFEGIRRMGAARAGLLTLVGPPVTVLAAWVLLGERLTATQILGSVLVLGGVAWLRSGAAAGRTA